jgi:TPR repeat protein
MYLSKFLIGLALGSSLVLAPVQAEDYGGVNALKAYAVFKMGQYEKAHKMWLVLAEDGNATAMNNIANLYEQGLGVERNLITAADWLRKSAETGNTVGQLQLGMAYEQGLGVPQDNRQAAYWFEQAAVQGDRDAQFNLGVMLATNYGTTENPTPAQLEQARAWIEKAHAQNHPEAKTFLQMLP